MKKRFVAFLLCGILAGLMGCESQDAYSEEEANELIDQAEETVREAESIDGFEKADYERFNSYASENGLGDTPIYIEGVIEEDPNVIGDGAFSFGLLQEDGNKWVVSILDSESSQRIIKEYMDKKVRVFCTYGGFSDKVNLPSVHLFNEDVDVLKKIRIEAKNTDGEYETIWKFDDWSDDWAEEQEESQKAENTDNIVEETMGQKNALASAKFYLETMPFSYTGLIEQLEYEQYSTEDATYAADNCGADWNEQAAKAAKNYLDIMPFSRDELIEQLQFEGYTYEQAVYGVEQNGY